MSIDNKDEEAKTTTPASLPRTQLSHVAPPTVVCFRFMVALKHTCFGMRRCWHIHARGISIQLAHTSSWPIHPVGPSILFWQRRLDVSRGMYEIPLAVLVLVFLISVGPSTGMPWQLCFTLVCMKLSVCCAITRTQLLQYSVLVLCFNALRRNRHCSWQSASTARSFFFDHFVATFSTPVSIWFKWPQIASNSSQTPSYTVSRTSSGHSSELWARRYTQCLTHWYSYFSNQHGNN